MLKHAEYQIFMCKNDVSPSVAEKLKIFSATGFVKWDDKGGCIVGCPSEKAWHEWWVMFELLQDMDHKQYLLDNDIDDDEEDDD